MHDVWLYMSCGLHKMVGHMVNFVCGCFSPLLGETVDSQAVVHRAYIRYLIAGTNVLIY